MGAYVRHREPREALSTVLTVVLAPWHWRLKATFCPIPVGTRVTLRPPDRSERALLTHSAPTSSM